MELNDNVIRHMSLAKVFNGKDIVGKINSIDFHRKDELMISADTDDAIRLYSTNSGLQQRMVQSKKYGACHITFTHHANSVLHASTKGGHALRNLSLHDNRYLRYFLGHDAPVTSLSMSPRSDAFISTSEDGQMRLWDLRASQCQGFMACPPGPCCTFDEQGLVFAVAVHSGVIKLFDARNCAAGPFCTFPVEAESNRPSTFRHVRFSLDGKLLAACVEGRMYMLDAFSGEVKGVMQTGMPTGSIAPEPTFSPDSKYLLSGCEDRAIRVWSTQTGREVDAWKGHAGIPMALKWAPQKALVASACTTLGLWLPDLDRLGISPNLPPPR